MHNELSKLCLIFLSLNFFDNYSKNWHEEIKFSNKCQQKLMPDGSNTAKLHFPAERRPNKLAEMKKQKVPTEIWIIKSQNYS